MAARGGGYSWASSHLTASWLVRPDKTPAMGDMLVGLTNGCRGFTSLDLKRSRNISRTPLFSYRKPHTLSLDYQVGDLLITVRESAFESKHSGSSRTHFVLLSPFLVRSDDRPSAPPSGTNGRPAPDLRFMVFSINTFGGDETTLVDGWILDCATE